MKLYQDIFFSSAIAHLIDSFVEFRKRKEEAKETDTPQWKALEQSYNDHLIWRFQYPGKVFGQQQVATWLITILVVALVVCGILFSFAQLYTAIKLKDFSSMQTELAVQTAGKVSISSSIIGAIVLVISLAFFYLYLKHVFQIQYPTPPHVGFEGTDAEKIFGHLRRLSQEEAAKEIHRLLDKSGDVIGLQVKNRAQKAKKQGKDTSKQSAGGDDVPAASQP
jgi:hypothetical protein